MRQGSDGMVRALPLGHILGSYRMRYKFHSEKVHSLSFIV